MFRVAIVLSVSALALAAPGGYGKPHNNLQCFSKPYKQCQQKPIQKQRQECHTEYDIKIDTTYIENCEEIVTQHCQEVSKQVHHTSAVVGHDSQVSRSFGDNTLNMNNSFVVQVIKGYGGYHKREADAEAEPGYGYSSGPKCHQNVQKQCHKVPRQNSRKVPRQVCAQVAVKVPFEVCGNSYVSRSQYATGYGYH